MENKNEFWKFVHSKQSNGSKNKIQLLRDDTYNCLSVSDTKDKLRVLKEHYQKLGKERHVEAFDSDWKIHVQTKIKEFEQLSEHIKNEHLDRKISNFEIEFVMKSIKNKKACGTDGIAGRLIKYGGSGMSMMLRELFQLIWESECIPEH